MTHDAARAALEPSYQQYRRTAIAEMTPWVEGFDMSRVSVSAPDKEAGSPRVGDMIARNPKNHDDKWLVAAAYFADNFEPITSQGDAPVAARPTIPTCCVTGSIPGDGGACGDCDPCIMGEPLVPEPVKRIIAEKNSLLHRIGELEDKIATQPAPAFGGLPAQITPEIACIIEDCGPPEKQTPEALAELVRCYQPTWTKIVEILSSLRAPDAGESEPIPLADHEEVGRLVLQQPWAVQAAIVTIAAHCVTLKDKYPSGDASDLAGCISQQCLELAEALSQPAPSEARQLMKLPLPEWLGPDTPENRERLQAFIEGRQPTEANAEARLREALEHVRAIISDGALTGFNCRDGDWAERLFASQALTLKALTASGGSDRCPMREKYETAAQPATSAVGRGDGPMPHGPATGDGQPVAAVGSNPATATNRPLDPTAVERREIMARIIDPEAFAPHLAHEKNPVMDSRSRIALAKADAILAALEKEEWHSPETAPRDGTPIHCRHIATFRWLPYKPASEQARRGIKGRWQLLNEYGGWDNTTLVPTAWCAALEGDRDARAE